MTDGVIKGTGNSRFLKSSISADTTLTQLITMLRDGTFPIDLNGINAAGWTTLATALNKANLLDDTTANKIATAMGVTAPTTPNEALNDLAVPPIYQKLLSTTVGTAAASVSLDLSGITISNYSAIIIEARVLTSATTTTEVTLNNLTSGYYGNRLSSGYNAVSTISNGASISGFRSRATSTYAYPTNISLKISCPFISGTPTNYCYTNVDFSGGETDLSTSGHIWGSCSVPTNNNALSSVQFIAGTGNIAVGSTFYVYGVKK